MKIIIGLVGSGKTTLYRKLNESKESYAVEIELPQSCLNDEEIKVKLFKLFYYNPNIGCIIAHPYYLPNYFWQRITAMDEILYLDLPFKKRVRRIKKRSRKLKVIANIFTNEFINQEEIDFDVFKKKGRIVNDHI